MEAAAPPVATAAAAAAAVASANTAAAHPHSVAAIFARAERVFERRVDQLLQLKRHKARLSGTTFNARKAKRDARTVAGREKLDALVRRLADLAIVQEAALGEQRSAAVAAALDVSAAVLVGAASLAVSNLSASPDSVAQQQNAANSPAFALCNGESDGPELPIPMPRDDTDISKDNLDTSSCSDDCSVGCGVANLKDIRDALPEVSDLQGAEYGTTPPAILPCDRHIFPATESVVNFVLECDEEVSHMYAPANMPRQRPGYVGKHEPGQGMAVNRYECHNGPAPCRSDWPPYYMPQSASSL